MHGVGRNRRVLRHAGRRPEVVQPEQDAEVGTHVGGELSFVQISDSHMGFNKPANPDVVGTLKAAVDKINGLATPPEFMLHTGDISHLSKPEEFDTVDQILKSASAKDVFFVPGEHDVLDDDGKQYLERYGKGAKGAGWYSFDKKGVHFIGLVNVLNLKAGGLGTLGGEQLEWLEDDVKHLKHSTPIVVFAHIPLWTRVPAVGLGNGRQRAGAGLPEEVRLGHGAERAHSPDDAEGRRKRDVPYGGVDSVSPTAARHRRFTGADESAGGATEEHPGHHGCDLRAREARAGGRRFFARVTVNETQTTVQTISADKERKQYEEKCVYWSVPGGVGAGNRGAGRRTREMSRPAHSRSPQRWTSRSTTSLSDRPELTVMVGTTVTWTNRDDIPHTVVSTDKVFKSKVLDTDEKFSFTFSTPGTFPYFCSIHPKMTGKVVVQ